MATARTPDNTIPLSSCEQQQQQTASASSSLSDYKMQQRTRSQDMVEEHHHHIVDEDPLLISQSLTYVTDDGSVLHTFQSSPFSWGTFYCSTWRKNSYNYLSFLGG
jgi:hypothetical protein